MAGRTERVLALPTYNQGTIFGPGSEPKQSIFEESITQQHRLGAKFIDGDRIFRYTKNGAVALSKALMTQTQVIETKTQEIVQTGHTWAVGDISGTMLITTGGTFALNEFTDGWLIGTKVAAVGDIYRIMASQIQSSDTIIDLELETPIRTAISATTELSMVPNRWYDVVVFPTTTTGYATGVPLIDITASYYFWAQTGGPCPILVDDSETVVIGDQVGPPATMADVGACGVYVTINQSWGQCLLVAPTDEPALINLTIDL